MEVADPSTSGGAPDSAAPAVNGSAEAATPSTEGTAKKVKKEKKVCTEVTACSDAASCTADCAHGCINVG